MVDLAPRAAAARVADLMGLAAEGAGWTLQLAARVAGLAPRVAAARVVDWAQGLAVRVAGLGARVAAALVADWMKGLAVRVAGLRPRLAVQGLGWTLLAAAVQVAEGRADRDLVMARQAQGWAARCLGEGMPLAGCASDPDFSMLCMLQGTGSSCSL